MTIRPSSHDNLRVCPGSYTVRGVDVSGYDVDTSWATVKNQGFEFAFIKATEGGTYVNPQFKKDWMETKRAGVIRGAYHFFRPARDAELQAEHFCRTVGLMDGFDLPPVLDWEVSDRMTVGAQISRALHWLQLVEKETKKIPMIYCSPGYFNSLKNPTEFARYPLWVANYGVQCPHVPPPWHEWRVWQNGDNSRVPGINAKKADTNLFNGTMAQLKRFCAGL